MVEVKVKVLKEDHKNILFSKESVSDNKCGVYLCNVYKDSGC